MARASWWITVHYQKYCFLIRIGRMRSVESFGDLSFYSTQNEIEKCFIRKVSEGHLRCYFMQLRVLVGEVDQEPEGFVSDGLGFREW